MIEIESDSELLKFITGGIPFTKIQIEERLQKLIADEQSMGETGVWAAEMKNSQEFVGWFMLRKFRFDHHELGFLLPKRHWCRGFATEVSQAIVDHAFKKLNLEKIVAISEPANQASIKVLEKIGMKYCKMISINNAISKKDVDLQFFEIAQA